MRNPFDFNWQAPSQAQVDKATKGLPYTVTNIGVGPEAIAHWKAEQEKFEAEWNIQVTEKRKILRAAVVALVADQSAVMSEQDKKETAIIVNGLKNIPGKQHLVTQLEEKIEKSTIEELKQKATKFISDMWSQAFDNDY